MSLNSNYDLSFPWWFILRNPPNKEVEIEIDFEVISEYILFNILRIKKAW